jgi:aldehyde:ferredoxin oxidoreductase
MECFARGVIPEEALGFSITFGEGRKTMQLIEDMALRKNEMGNLLADGIDKAAAKLGPDTKPYQRFVKGIGMPAHLARKKPGVGFGYLHGPNPNDHMKLEHDWIGSDPSSLKAFHLNIRSDPDALDKNKIEIARATQIYYAAMDALSLCLFVFGPGNVYTLEEIIEMLNAATGFDFGFDDLMEIGERAIQLQRKLYLDLGGTDEEFLSFLENEIPEGPSKGARIDRNDFYQARKHYYKLMGWDEDGRVLEETLKRFGI